MAPHPIMKLVPEACRNFTCFLIAFQILTGVLLYFFLMHLVDSSAENKALNLTLAAAKEGEQGYQEIRCKHMFEAMRQCCLKYKPVSLVCEGYSLEPRNFTPASDRPDKG